MPTSMSLATWVHCVCSGSLHIWTFHLIFLCCCFCVRVFSFLSKNSLEDISCNPTGGLWHLSTYWVCLFSPVTTTMAHSFALFAACRVRSHPRFGRSRGPMPELRRRRERLRVRGGTLQQHAPWRRYVIHLILQRLRCPDFPQFGRAGLKMDLEPASALLRIRLGKCEAFIPRRSHARLCFASGCWNVRTWGVLILHKVIWICILHIQRYANSRTAAPGGVGAQSCELRLHSLQLLLAFLLI